MTERVMYAIVFMVVLSRVAVLGTTHERRLAIGGRAVPPNHVLRFITRSATRRC
jgi:hypothetical protein